MSSEDSELEQLVKMIASHFRHLHPEGLEYKRSIVEPLAKKVRTWHHQSLEAARREARIEEIDWHWKLMNDLSDGNISLDFGRHLAKERLAQLKPPGSTVKSEEGK